MINIGSILSVSDNSGALFGCCLNVLKKSQHIGCSPGQTLVLNVKKTIFKKHITKKSKIILKGQICKALMIKSIRGLRRWGNFFFRCGKNSVILLNKYNAPYATRILGVVFKEVKESLDFKKFLSMSNIII